MDDFRLDGKFDVDSRTERVYLYNERGVYIPFFLRLSCRLSETLKLQIKTMVLNCRVFPFFSSSVPCRLFK